VTFTAAVFATAGSGTPTGIVTFQDGPTVLGSAFLNGAARATFSTAALVPGIHAITASYSGDATFASSNSGTLNQIVNRDSVAVVLTARPDPVLFGATVIFTAVATAAGPGAGAPTGVVTFQDGGVILGTHPLRRVNGGSRAVFATRTLAVGEHFILATYSGDANFFGNIASGFESIATASTTTVVKSSIDPSVFGQLVTFTATIRVSPPGSGLPSGMVTFKDGGTILGTSALTSAGIATLVAAGLSTGSHVITAIYGGDGSFKPSTSRPFGQLVRRGTSSAPIAAFQDGPTLWNDDWANLTPWPLEHFISSSKARAPTARTHANLDGTP
jgi:hypothetical protein